MPTIFPTIYSTLDPGALARFIGQQYGIGGATVKLLLRGVGDTYLATTPKNKFIIRVYRPSHRTEEQVREEVNFLLALKENKVPAAYPIPDKNGNIIQSIVAAEGIKNVVLFTYAPGMVVPSLNEGQLLTLGRQIARMHNVSAAQPISTSRAPYTLETTLFQPLELLRNAFASNPDVYAWLQAAAREIATRLSEFDTSAFSTGICHFDLLPKNFHFDCDAPTFFDFDFMAQGWLILDLMTFRQQLCLDILFGRLTPEAATKAFNIVISGYREFRHISDDELAAIPLLSLCFWLFYSGFHTTHDQFYMFLDPAQLKSRFNFVRHIVERDLKIPMV